MLALAALGSTIFAVSMFLAAERLEQNVLVSHAREEFDTFAQRARVEPEVTTVRSALLLAFAGRDNPDLPPEFAALRPGDHHAVVVGDRSYQVRVGKADGRELFVGHDVTDWEALEQPVINVLIAGVVLESLLAVVLGFWISAQVIAPVTALSTRLTSLDPRERNVRVAARASGEITPIAEAFDRYMERLDGFVEREQLFTAAAAHELRTPLAVIQGATEVLAEQGGLPAAAERAIARLERATRDMREFIEALLFLSREEQRDDAESASSDVGHIVRQLADDYRAIVGRASAGGKPVEIVVTAAALRIEAPPALATIVISNLLRNAIEHTDEGEVRIALEDRVLTITDTGRGIPAEAQARLFTRGYSTKTSGGMGLHLTKRICDRLGWRLTIASSTGKGTVASVEF